MLKELCEKVEDPFLIDYMRWLLEDPFIRVLLKVREIKIKKFERGLILKEQVTQEEVFPISDFSCSLIDPFDNFLWKLYTDHDGCCEFKIIPVSDSEKFNYRILTESEMIEFDPLQVQKIELVFTSRGREIHLMRAEAHSELFTACPICNKKILKTAEIECPICKTNVCRECLITEGFFKKRSMCKSCKNKK